MIGIVAGTFDILHPGYIHLFNTMGDLCSSIYVYLRHNAPEHKSPLIFSYEDRISQLYLLRKVELVLGYTTEEELESLLLQLDPKYFLRFLDVEYQNKPIVAKDHLKIHYVNRVLYKSSTWSQTLLKEILKNEH